RDAVRSGDHPQRRDDRRPGRAVRPGRRGPWHLDPLDRRRGGVGSRPTPARPCPAHGARERVPALRAVQPRRPDPGVGRSPPAGPAEPGRPADEASESRGRLSRLGGPSLVRTTGGRMRRLRSLLALTWAYVLETWRSKPALFWNLLLPLLFMVGLGYVFGG